MQIKLNDTNPRTISKEKLSKLINSIKQFPKMLELRPIVVDKDGVILGGKKYVCKSCGKTFYSKKGCKNRTPKYCGKECYGESIRKYKKCRNCGKVFYKWSNKIFCSDKCHREYRKNKTLSMDWKKALSEGRKKSIKCRGENLYNWKGGKETEKLRRKVCVHKRRALLKENTIYGIDKKFIEKLMNKQGGKCFYCLKMVGNDKLCLEHLTPIIRGGGNEPYNLVLSCKSCNSKKRSKTLEEYMLLNKINYSSRWENLFLSL